MWQMKIRFYYNALNNTPNKQQSELATSITIIKRWQQECIYDTEGSQMKSKLQKYFNYRLKIPLLLLLLISAF